MAADAFSELVATMDGAMVVVTVAVGDERDGCLVGFHSQASIDPPRYSLWLSVANRTCRLALNAEVLAVHLLTSDQHDIAELFGGTTGDEVDKLTGISWEPGPNGVPLLEDCPNRFVGRIVGRQDSDGDHVSVLLDPVIADVDAAITPLRLHDAIRIDPGHPA